MKWFNRGIGLFLIKLIVCYYYKYERNDVLSFENLSINLFDFLKTTGFELIQPSIGI